MKQLFGPLLHSRPIDLFVLASLCAFLAGMAAMALLDPMTHHAAAHTVSK